MIRVGLTGGLGSGKSAVRDLLAARGADVFDADSVAKDLMTHDPAVKQQLESILGPDSWLPSGELDRPFIARRLFADDDLRSRVNAVVHPAVHTAFDKAVDEASAQGVPMIVREAALLPAVRQLDQLDTLIAVKASKPIRVQRALDRGGLSLPDIERRIAAQPGWTEYAALADRILDNNGTMDELETQVDELWNELVGSRTEGA